MNDQDQQLWVKTISNVLVVRREEGEERPGDFQAALREIELDDGRRLDVIYIPATAMFFYELYHGEDRVATYAMRALSVSDNSLLYQWENSYRLGDEPLITLSADMAAQTSFSELLVQ